MVHHIENNQINEEVLKNSEKLVVVDFFATWCMPCQMLAPILAEVSEKYSDSAEFYKVNVDENQDSAIRYGVESVPTLVFFKDDIEVERQVGLLEEAEISKIIEELK